MKFRTDYSVTMLSGVRPFILPDHLECFFSNRPHFLHIGIFFHIEDWSNMQATNRCMCVPGSTGPMLRENFSQSIRIFSQVFQRNSTILYKRDWFSSALHRHHYVKALLPNFGYSCLKRRFNSFDDSLAIP